MEVENTNLEPVRRILLHESSLSLPRWLGESDWKRTLSTDSNVRDSPIFDHRTWLGTMDPLGWNCLACTLENKQNTSAECITGSETSFLCYFWSLATENVLPRVVFLRCGVWVCGGKRHTQGLPRVSPQLPLSHSSCLGRKSSLSGKTQ